MKESTIYRLLTILTGWLLLTAFPLPANGQERMDGLDSRIQFPRSRGKETVYQLLNLVSERSGYLFIYDSELIDNEQVAHLPKGKYTIREAIYRITGDSTLHLRLINRHILISRPKKEVTEKQNVFILPDTLTWFTLEGILRDKYTNEPVPFATISVKEDGSISNITNQEGEFRLRLPDTLRQSNIRFSHVGYQPTQMECTLLADRYSMLTLEPKVIPIQEVVVRIVNPIRLLREMQENRSVNYAQTPVYQTAFYREGIQRKNKFVSLTEAIFQIYKSANASPTSADQVKLLKMRRITDQQEKDTIIAKMKSGIHACLQLDIMKDMPDFLLPDGDVNYPYVYAHSDITVTDNRVANVISFEQRKFINHPLLKGNLYIDSENSALLRAEFEINPLYVAHAAGMLVEKKSRHLKIIPQKVAYTISYKPWNGRYYISHVRGDLHFRVKKRKQLFGNSSPLHVWFEMVTCRTDTANVSRFDRKETLSTRTIFSETKFKYDESFWGNFNVIPAEEKLYEAIRKITSKIEETSY